MTKKVILAALLAVATVCGASAQKFKPAPDFLKGQTEINVVFDYSKVTFDGDSQAEYYKEKGTAWVSEWEGKRRDNNVTSFSTSFNEELQQIGMSAGEYSSAAYTIIVDVVDCDFGAYAGPFSVPASLECTLRIVKTGSTETLASMNLEESQNPNTVIATPVDFDRIFLAFTEVGEEAGEVLVKALKK
ncbi:MAG: hypothetical protein LBR55_07495 [Bacteroidales bacterium]|jgi:hypothetical protein|nr:hypothetical protein [Bacteroidales bacterium]